MGKNKVIDIREVFTENDDTMWTDIPGFSGYQLSNKGHVRSYKQLKKYPYGTLKRFGMSYTLTDNNNITRTMQVSELKLLCENLQQYPTYCRETLCRGRGRNQRCFIDSSIKLSSNVIRTHVPIRKEKCGIFKFTIVPDNIIKPIRFIHNELL